MFTESYEDFIARKEAEIYAATGNGVDNDGDDDEDEDDSE
jgi:hypothetical protein